MSILSPTSTSPSFLLPPIRHRHLLLRRPKPKSSGTSSSLSVSNPFILEIAEKLEDSLSLSHSQLPLQKLRDSSSQSLVSRTWPRRKLRLEPFLYNDFSFLENSQITPAPSPQITLSSTPSPSLTILNGHVISPPSSLLPSGVFAGSLRDLIIPNNKILSLLNDRFVDGDLFFDLNGVGAADVAVVYVPEGVRVEGELYLKFCYDGEGGEGKMGVSNPKVLILVEKGAELAVVEEHFEVEGSDGKCYWANAVVEVVVEEGASVVHSYVQRQGRNSAHTKWTLTRQVIWIV